MEMQGYRPDNGMHNLMRYVRASMKVNEEKSSVSQNVHTVEEPEFDVEEKDLEDYSKEELNDPKKPAPKSKSKDSKYAVTEVPDSAVQNLKPKKESKVDEKGDLHLCNNCFKTFRNDESVCTHCRSNIVEKIVQEYEEEDSDDSPALSPPKSKAVIANHAYQGLAKIGYWHTETISHPDREDYEFIGTDLPKVIVSVKHDESPE
jgi:hypothetical protein